MPKSYQYVCLEIFKLTKFYYSDFQEEFKTNTKFILIFQEEGGTESAFDDESDVRPPTPNSRFSSRQSFGAGGAPRTPGNHDKGGEDLFDDTFLDKDHPNGDYETFGSNEGAVVMPYYWRVTTHPPADGEVGRTKKVHLIVQLLSCTIPSDGYSVFCPPKGQEIIISLTHSKVQAAFWGPQSRKALSKGLARDSMQEAAAEYTTNFTDVPTETQRIEFPFVLDSIVMNRPLGIRLFDQKAGIYLGLYVCAKLDWTDTTAAAAGEDLFELESVPSAEDGGGFYKKQESDYDDDVTFGNPKKFGNRHRPHNNRRSSGADHRATRTNRPFKAAPAASRDASANEEDPQILLLCKLLEAKTSLSAKDLVHFLSTNLVPLLLYLHQQLL